MNNSDLSLLRAPGTRQRFFFEHDTHAPRDAIWALWTDVETWKHWDEGLADAVADGPLRANSRGMIIPNIGLRSAFEVTAFEAGESYTISTRLVGATLHVHRRFVDHDEGCRFRHEVWFSGPLRLLWAALLGGGFRRALPTTMRKLAAHAEQSASERA